MKLLQKDIDLMIGKKVPYERWPIWGQPETLEGTNNQYWVAFLPIAVISFVSIKETDMVIHAGFGTKSSFDFIDKLMEKS